MPPEPGLLIGRPRFGDARTAALEAIEILRPPQSISVTECALRHRRISNPKGYSGPWRDDMTPYVCEPQDLLTSLRYEMVAVVGPAQSGKTTIAENWHLHSQLYDPAAMLWFMPDADLMKAYLTATIGPMHELHPDLAAKVTGKNTEAMKEYGHPKVLVEWLPATPNAMISKKAPRIVLDEIDAYKKALGDTITIVRQRQRTYDRSAMILVVSHPDRGRRAGVFLIYQDSDRRVWWWRCPHCGQASSPNPDASRYMKLGWEDDKDLPKPERLAMVKRSAYLLCPVNGCLISNADRKGLVHVGWAGDGQDVTLEGEILGEIAPRPVAGFWITGTMSPFLSLGQLASEFVDKKIDFDLTHKDRDLRQVVAKTWGFPYSRRDMGLLGVSLDALKRHRDGGAYLMEEVPDGVRYLVAAVDVQGDRFEALIEGYGADGESWIIDRFSIDGVKPATVAADWDRLLDEVVRRTYPAAGDPTLQWPMACTVVDTGGEPGVTPNARAFAKRAYAAGIAPWQLRLIKGASTKTAPLLPQRPAFETDDRGKAIEGSAPIYVIGVYELKDTMDVRLQIRQAGPGYCHFPSDLPDWALEELTAEVKEDGDWLKTGERNETWDLKIYNLANSLFLRPDRQEINWADPPIWARPIETQEKTAPAMEASEPFVRTRGRLEL